MQLMILDMGAQGPSARYPLGVAGKTSDILCLADNDSWLKRLLQERVKARLLSVAGAGCGGAGPAAEAGGGRGGAQDRAG